MRSRGDLCLVQVDRSPLVKVLEGIVSRDVLPLVGTTLPTTFVCAITTIPSGRWGKSRRSEEKGSLRVEEEGEEERRGRSLLREAETEMRGTPFHTNHWNPYPTTPSVPPLEREDWDWDCTNDPHNRWTSFSINFLSRCFSTAKKRSPVMMGGTSTDLHSPDPTSRSRWRERDRGGPIQNTQRRLMGGDWEGEEERSERSEGPKSQEQRTSPEDTRSSTSFLVLSSPSGPLPSLGAPSPSSGLAPCASCPIT